MFVFCLFAPCPHGYSVSRGGPKIKIVKTLMKKSIPKTAKIRWIFGVLDGFVRRRVLVVRN